MAVTQYIGARYVPLFADPIDWDSTKHYEPLTIVYHQGNSFTSKQFVPTGIDITNTDYWVLTGNYNAQVEQYRREVRSFDGRITANAQAIADEVTARMAEDTAIRGLITDEVQARTSGDANLQGQISAETTRAKEAENGIADELTRSSPLFFTVTTNEPYIGVPDITSWSVGVVRFIVPGIYIIQSDILIPSLTSNSKLIKRLEYYVSHTPTETPFEANKIFYDIVEWKTGYTANIHISATFIFNCTPQMFKKAGNEYIDLLIDLFSYDLTEGDPNIPVEVTFNVVKIKEFKKGA